MQPPEVSAATGGDFTGVGKMLGQQSNQASGSGGNDPIGSLKQEADLLRRVIDSMSKKNDKFAPFGAKAISIIEAGVAEAGGAASPSPGQGSGSQPPMAGAPGGMSGAPGGGSGFPG